MVHVGYLLFPFGCYILSPSSIQEIHSQGCFGKGEFSRSKPMNDVHEYNDRSAMEQAQLYMKKINENSDKTEIDIRYDTKERIVLSHEETFYLVYHDCLEVIEVKTVKSNRKIEKEELFQLFCSVKGFEIKWAVYYYLRNLGWIVKSGLRFGVDYILYSDHPEKSHSLYGVVLKSKEKSESHDNFLESWVPILRTLRIANSVSKGIIFCYCNTVEGLSYENIIKISDIECVMGSTKKLNNQ